MAKWVLCTHFTTQTLLPDRVEATAQPPYCKESVFVVGCFAPYHKAVGLSSYLTFSSW